MDRVAPGALSGLYLVGSVALGDYHPRRSNIDLVAVSDRAWDVAAPEAALRLHADLGGRREPARLAYASVAELATDPAAGHVLCYQGTELVRGDELANPFTWQLLADEAVALRGPEWLSCWQDGPALQAWARRRLATRWQAWARSARHRPAALWIRLPVTEGLLEVARLYVMATTGVVLSKTAAGPAVLADVPERYSRIVRDAVGYRGGSGTSMYWGFIERKRDALGLVDTLIDLAQPDGAADQTGSDR